MLPRMGPIANSLSPATQCDVLEILQREQDRAIELLSSSPLLASLFVSYANQAAALESASAIPSPESEEWKMLQNTTAALQGEVEKLKSENIEIVERSKASVDSQEAFRSRLSSKPTRFNRMISSPCGQNSRRLRKSAINSWLIRTPRGRLSRARSLIWRYAQNSI